MRGNRFTFRVAVAALSLVAVVVGGAVLWDAVTVPDKPDEARRLAARSAAAPPVILWDRTFGGARVDAARGLIALGLDGYAVVARSRSRRPPNETVWFLRLDGEGGMLGERVFEDEGRQSWATDLVALPDGGFVFSGAVGDRDIQRAEGRLVRLDAEGGTVWDRRYGGTAADSLTGIALLPGGDLLAVGSVSSKGAGDFDLWVVRVAPEGTVVFEKTFGGEQEDTGFAVAITADGGAVVGGGTASKGSGGGDAWILRLDGSGDLLWDRTFGGTDYDVVSTVAVRSDGSILFGGHTRSKGPEGGGAWIVALDAGGELLWERILPAMQEAWVNHLVALPDGGLAAVGLYRDHADGPEQGFLARLDGAGRVLWVKPLSGARDDNAIRVTWLADGGFAVAGFTSSKGGGEGDGDVWLVRLGYAD